LRVCGCGVIFYRPSLSCFTASIGRQSQARGQQSRCQLTYSCVYTRMKKPAISLSIVTCSDTFVLVLWLRHLVRRTEDDSDCSLDIQAIAIFNFPNIPRDRLEFICTASSGHTALQCSISWVTADRIHARAQSCLEEFFCRFVQSVCIINDKSLFAMMAT
jgi:hypothetical protein